LTDAPMADAPALPRLSALRVVGWLVVFLVVGSVLTAVFSSSYLILAHGGIVTHAPTPGAASAEQVLVSGLSLLLGFLGATWVVGVRALRMSWRDLRWAVPRAAPGMALGMLLGVAAAAAALLLAVPSGGAHWTPDAGTAGDYVCSVVHTTAVLAPAALSEEVLFRGVPLLLLAALLGRWPALVLLSVLFALAHALNPNATAPGLANIALAGILLSLAFFAPGGIWTAWGAHLGWNATLAALDAPVSGTPFRIPFIDYEPGGPWWLTGGAFGPEGGLTATVAICAAIVVAWRWGKKEQT
jgi:membrane protease YdiL (CAAX protease family)